MISVAKFWRSPLAAAILVSVSVSLVILGLRRLGYLEYLELAAYDWFIRLRPEASEPDSRIVLIGITEADIRKLGRWPVTDATLAQAMEILTQYRPRAIGLDIFRDISVPPGSEELKTIFTRNRHIIATMKFGEDASSGIPPPPGLKDTDQVGFNDMVVDRDGIVRRALLFLDDGAQVSYSFALRLALLYLKSEGITPQPDRFNPQHVRLGRTAFRPFESNDGGYLGADARGYQILLDLQGFRKPFLSFPLIALLSGEINPAMIKGKIVLIGVTTESVKDAFYTSYSRGLQSAQQIFGVALHAHIVSQLLRSSLEGSVQVASPSERQKASWILLWGIMGGALGLWVRSPWRYALFGASGLLILTLAVYIAFLNGWWIPLVPPAMGWLVSAALVTACMSNQEKKQRALLMQLFARHVSPEVAEILWVQRDEFLDGGRPRSQKLIATVLFSDLKGFTRVSEKMDPQALMEWLNAYMETMAQLVMDHGGVVDDYFGDAIKANFGLPLPRKTEAEISRDAVNAVSCALAMEREINRLNAIWQEQNLPTVSMRIGIFTGPVVVGCLGSAQRLKYTTVGDTVNVASRLESFDKDVFDPDFASRSCRILVGETTLCYLDDQFETQRVSETTLEGKEEKIIIYRVLGRGDP